MLLPLEKREIYLSEDLAITMIKVPGGNFLMGSEEEYAHSWEKPVHEVVLSPYWIAETPVTQAQWEAIMGSNPSFFQGANRPVEQVSWDDAQDFIRKLNDRTQESFRLPTEDQWEYAARGGRRSQFKFAGSNKLDEVSWYRGNSHGETKPVKLKSPNELGLYDMSGNAWEWCQDIYSNEYYEKSRQKGLSLDPEGPKKGAFKAIRGGSWGDGSRICHVSNRYGYDLIFRSYDLGFRLSLPD